MSDLEQALLALVERLETCKLPYVLIGGLAVAASGEPRSTLDVDVSVWVEDSGLGQAVECLCKRFNSRSHDPLRFVEQTRVLPLEDHQGIRLDVVFAVLPIQREAIQRGVPWEVEGKQVQVASVEDLILMKLISERPKDIDDATALLRRHRSHIDQDYLRPKLAEMSAGLDRPDILDTFDRIMKSVS